MGRKIPLGQISMETNHANKRKCYFEFVNWAWLISSKYAEKKSERFSLSV